MGTGRVSAGLLMYRFREGSLEVFLAHPGGPFFARKNEGHWTIPKGEPNEGEDLLETAQREFEEEVGIKPHGPFIELGAIRQKGGKVVHGWAFEGDQDGGVPHKSNEFRMEWPPNSGKWESFLEIDRVSFFSVEEAHLMIKGTQGPFIETLRARLQGKW